MNYIVHNHLNSAAYKSFVPLVTKKSNGKILKIIVGFAAIGLLVWWITRPSEDETQENQD
jgi:hypothetical protein